MSKPVYPDVLRSRIAVGARFVEAEDTLREYACEMERLAVTDSLAGVYNRRYFFEQAEKEFRLAGRYNAPFSVWNRIFVIPSRSEGPLLKREAYPSGKALLKP